MRTAGFGTAVITPEPPVMLAGFGARHDPATEVHDDLEVRSVYLADTDTGSAVCLLVCDLLGMSEPFARPAREATAAALGLPVEAVLTACTHTHSGPSCIAGSEAIGWPTPAGYGDLLVAGCLRAALAARDAAVPASLLYREAALPGGVSLNRRGLPYSPWMALLDVRDEDGVRLGTVANLAIHPVALGPECLAVSADWVASFRSALEATAGGTTVMLSGALGDVNPHHVHRQDNDCGSDGFAEAEALGRSLAEAVGDELGAAASLEGPIAVVRAEQLDLAMGETLLTGLMAGRQEAVEVLEWSVGGARMVSVPGEAFQAFGDAIRQARSGPVLIAGLAPTWLGYLPVPFTEGYEEMMSLGASFVSGLLAALTSV